MATAKFVIKGNVFEVFDHYTDLQYLGGGSYGHVCSANDTRNSRKVAIKKITDVFKDLVDAKRILREVKLLRHMGPHENVISILDLFTMPLHTEDFTDVYIVTNLMQSDLERIIGSKQDLTDAHAKYFIYQLLRGIKYVHSANILHRDLKPGNVLVNSNCMLAICDFGLARGITIDAGPEEDLTEYVVTRWYRAPELLTNCDTYGFAMDVWSIGCIFAEILGRKVLFRGRNYIHQLQVILNVLGTPSTKQLRFITYDEAKASIRAQGFKPKVPFATLFPKASPMALDLLSKMLVFDPTQRCTVEEALAHPYLAEYHAATHEPLADRAFNFDWEQEGGGGVRMPKKIIQRLMLGEVADFHPDKVPPGFKPRESRHEDGMDDGTGMAGLTSMGGGAGGGGGMHTTTPPRDGAAATRAAIPVAPSPRMLERALTGADRGSAGGEDGRPPKRQSVSPRVAGAAGQAAGAGAGGMSVDDPSGGGKGAGGGGAGDRRARENRAFLGLIDQSRRHQNTRRQQEELDAAATGDMSLPPAGAAGATGAVGAYAGRSPSGRGRGGVGGGGVDPSDVGLSRSLAQQIDTLAVLADRMQRQLQEQRNYQSEILSQVAQVVDETVSARLKDIEDRICARLGLTPGSDADMIIQQPADGGAGGGGVASLSGVKTSFSPASGAAALGRRAPPPPPH